MPALSRSEAIAFLASWPARLAHVSTPRADGDTRTVPVWYRIDEEAERMLIWSGTQRKWVQRVGEAGRLSFSAAEDGFPLRGVMGGGPARVLVDGDVDVDREREAVIERYVMGHLVDAYTGSRGEYRAIIAVELERLEGWTFAPSTGR